MTQRIVDIGAQGAYVSSRAKQIVFRRGGAQHAASYSRADGSRLSSVRQQTCLPGLERSGEEAPREMSVPAEDLGVLVLDHVQCTVTLTALAGIAQAGGVVIVCNGKHVPTALCLPLSTHSETVHRVYDQLTASRPLVKRLWRQLVQAKIRNQAANLAPGSAPHSRLLELAESVLTGDSGNAEAAAAQVYWRAWLDDRLFRRDPEEEGVNGLLNYGYALIRAAMARALVGSGFCCAIGLFHHHRANAFCLADDMLEPLRPLVDARVRRMTEDGLTAVNPEAKRRLYQLLLDPLRLDGQRLPLLDATQRMSASLAACLARDRTRLLLPQPEEAGAW